MVLVAQAYVPAIVGFAPSVKALLRRHTRRRAVARSRRRLMRAEVRTSSLYSVLPVACPF